MNEFNYILNIVKMAEAFGFRELTSGTKLYGHTPHIAPEAWLHTVFPPLEEGQIEWIEQQVETEISGQFREFLLLANGLDLFSGALSIYGTRFNYLRYDDDVSQPFSIEIANTRERPKHISDTQLVVGTYKDDGSRLIVDMGSNQVIRKTSRGRKPLDVWPHFWTMLKSETYRISQLFDASGHQLTKLTRPQKDPLAGS